jgi:ADP-ribose pyrophosphatase YjhB (NUDIX family)
VKKTGTPLKSTTWEPPKGQMEGKDGLRHPKTPIFELLYENVKREVEEEARIKSKDLKHLVHTGLVFQAQEDTYPPNTYFQYHIFNCVVSKKTWTDAAATLDWYRTHPVAFSKLSRDLKEKDMLKWYSPTETPLSTRWSNKIVGLYLKKFS